MIIVDINNTYYNVRTRFNGKKLDYRKVLASIPEPEKHFKVAYGIAASEIPELFVGYLKACGFSVSYRITGNFRCNSNVEITINALTSKDDIIILSNNIDLLPLVVNLRQAGRKVTLISTHFIKELSSYCSTIFITEEMLEQPKESDEQRGGEQDSNT